jgi:hypothetical protein
MISKFIGSSLFGLILILLLDFLIFIGIKINYIDFYHMKEYYNVLFVDHQSYILLGILSIIFGYFILKKSSSKIFTIFYIILVFLSLLTFYKPIGHSIAQFMFRKDNISFKVGSINFKGDLLYKGRRNTYIYRKDINKVIRLKNSELFYSQ